MTKNNFRLQSLISECKWEYKKIGDIVTRMYTGSLPKISERRKGNFPVIQLRDISHLKHPFIYEGKTFLDASNITNKKTATFGDILMIYDSGIRIVGKTFMYKGETECIIGPGIHVIKHNQNPSYLLHALNLPYIQKKIKEIAGLTNQMFGLFGSFRLNDLKKISIPIPSLETQEKIANYLDDLLLNNIKLENDLERMIEIRKKQYEYYKELILTSEISKWDIKSLSEIATEIYSGNGVTEEQLDTGPFPAIKNKDITKMTNYFTECISFVDPELIKNKRYFEFGNLLISNMGGKNIVGKGCAYLGKDRCIAGNHVIVVKHKENPKFLSYMLSSQMCRTQINQRSKGVTVNDLNLSAIKKIQIPLPSLKEQEEIVSKLDKLNHKVSELEMYTNLLIQARNKQYNVYSGNMFNKNQRQY